MQDQRHVKRAFVDEIAVRRFAVFFEALPVIGQQDHQRFVPPLIADERLLESPQHLIDIGEFGVVTRKTIGRVQIEQMYKRKHRLPAVGRQPLRGGANHQGSIAPDSHLIRIFGFARSGGLERTVVKIEALIETEPAGPRCCCR